MINKFFNINVAEHITIIAMLYTCFSLIVFGERATTLDIIVFYTYFTYILLFPILKTKENSND